MIELFSNIKSQLTDAPVEVKKSFNTLVKYFSELNRVTPNHFLSLLKAPKGKKVIFIDEWSTYHRMVRVLIPEQYSTLDEYTDTLTGYKKLNAFNELRTHDIDWKDGKIIYENKNSKSFVVDATPSESAELYEKVTGKKVN